DLQIQLDASRLNDLDAVTGAELPDVGPVSLAARLTTEDNLYRVGELAARLSRSDVGGEITLQLGGDRPRLTADLKSDRIDVAELVGEEPSAGGGAPDESSDAEPPATDDDESDQPAGLLIPDDPLPFDALNALDADAKLHVAKLTTHLGANADDLSVEIDLAEGDLRIAPLTGKSAGGDFEMTLEVLTQQQQTADMNLDLKFRQWRMGTFSEIIRSSGESIGKLDADIQLAGTGGSPHAIASTLDGEVKLIGKGGAVDSTVMQILSIGLGSLFDVFGGDKESTFLNCFVVRFDFTDGIGTAHDFLVDFEDLAILGSGTIDLRDEQLDLLFTPESKNQSFVSLAVPFDVAGPLSSPSIRPNPTGSGVQLMKGAGLALLFLNPVTVLPAAAAAAAIIGTGMVVDAAGENPCVVALSHAAAVEEAEPEEGWFDKVKDAIGAN
ncbi:MAG: AsmA-like C-terminal region-containing protein, partial [Pseudomonadota bacterium]